MVRATWCSSLATFSLKTVTQEQIDNIYNPGVGLWGSVTSAGVIEGGPGGFNQSLRLVPVFMTWCSPHRCSMLNYGLTLLLIIQEGQHRQHGQ